MDRTEWLRYHTRQAHAAGTTNVLVVTSIGSDATAAYYAWSMARISIEDAPARVLTGTEWYPQPVVQWLASE